MQNSVIEEEARLMFDLLDRVEDQFNKKIIGCKFGQFFSSRILQPVNQMFLINEIVIDQISDLLRMADLEKLSRLVNKIFKLSYRVTNEMTKQFQQFYLQDLKGKTNHLLTNPFISEQSDEEVINKDSLQQQFKPDREFVNLVRLIDQTLRNRQLVQSKTNSFCKQQLVELNKRMVNMTRNASEILNSHSLQDDKDQQEQLSKFRNSFHMIEKLTDNLFEKLELSFKDTYFKSVKSKIKDLVVNRQIQYRANQFNQGTQCESDEARFKRLQAQIQFLQQDFAKSQKMVELSVKEQNKLSLQIQQHKQLLFERDQNIRKITNDYNKAVAQNNQLSKSIELLNWKVNSSEENLSLSQINLQNSKKEILTLRKSLQAYNVAKCSVGTFTYTLKNSVAHTSTQTDLQNQVSDEPRKNILKKSSWKLNKQKTQTPLKLQKPRASFIQPEEEVDEKQVESQPFQSNLAQDDHSSSIPMRSKSNSLDPAQFQDIKQNQIYQIPDFVVSKYNSQSELSPKNISQAEIPSSVDQQSKISNFAQKESIVSKERQIQQIVSFDSPNATVEVRVNSGSERQNVQVRRETRKSVLKLKASQEQLLKKSVSKRKTYVQQSQTRNAIKTLANLQQNQQPRKKEQPKVAINNQTSSNAKRQDDKLQIRSIKIMTNKQLKDPNQFSSIKQLKSFLKSIFDLNCQPLKISKISQALNILETALFNDPNFQSDLRKDREIQNIKQLQIELFLQKEQFGKIRNELEDKIKDFSQQLQNSMAKEKRLLKRIAQLNDQLADAKAVDLSKPQEPEKKQDFWGSIIKQLKDQPHPQTPTPKRKYEPLPLTLKKPELSLQLFFNSQDLNVFGGVQQAYSFQILNSMVIGGPRRQLNRLTNRNPMRITNLFRDNKQQKLQHQKTAREFMTKKIVQIKEDTTASPHYSRNNSSIALFPADCQMSQDELQAQLSKYQISKVKQLFEYLQFLRNKNREKFYLVNTFLSYPYDCVFNKRLHRTEFSFEQFRKIYSKVLKGHRKCGAQCQHLQKFNNKIGYSLWLQKRKEMLSKKKRLLQ